MDVEHEHDNGFSVGAPMDDTVSTGRGLLSIGTRIYIARVPIYEAVSGHPPATWTPTPMPMPPPPPPCEDKATGRRKMSAKQRERSVSTAKVAAKVKGMLQEIGHCHVRRDRKMVRFGGEEDNAASGSGGGAGGRSRSRSILKGYVSLLSGG